MAFKLVLIALACVLVYANADCIPNSILERGVQPAEQNEIVNRHNAYRLQLAKGQISGQPKASNMKRMRWDTKLASAAQTIAETCNFAHVKVTDNRFQVGQNLYTWASTAVSLKADWTSAVQAWFDEVKSYTFGTTQYNHYTQVVWADTYLVGCGYTHYKNSKGWFQKLYVCNYGPAGNWFGETPYQTGNGCDNLC